MAAATTTQAPPRHLLRSTGAVLSGLVTIFVTHLGTDQLFHALGVYPPWGQPMHDTGLLLLALGYRAVFSVLGCYVTARLAPRAPMGHALALGGIGLVLSTLGAIAAWDLGPRWYPLALALVAVPSAWLGGKLHAWRHGGA
jgi:hypothetical protein